MKDGRQFNADLGAWAKRAGDRLDALARQTSQEVSERVVRATPVDTGFLRSSWQPSIGSPKSGSGSEGQPNRALGDIGLVASSVKAGDVYWMTNNAAYARHVEFGTSRMAGRFYVTDTVARWKSIVDRVARDLRLK
jgi:hypothetical protein